MTLTQDDPPAGTGDPGSGAPRNTGAAHIERERAAYIGGTKTQRLVRIRRLWAHVSQNSDRFRSPGHHSPSAPLHRHTLLDDNHSELLVQDTPGRHIYYVDSLSLELDGNHVQVRLERKQRIKGVSLKESFDAVTVKIGEKAQSRIEESVRVDLAHWKEHGFYAALKAGMKTEIEALKALGEGKAAKKRYKELLALKDALIEAVGHEELKALEVFPLVHLTRNTVETRLSPQNDPASIVEIKTDLCESVGILGHRRSFAQFEAEGIAGDFNHVERIMAEFCANPRLALVPTNDSKADPSFADLRPWIMPQNTSAAEELRVRGNRALLKSRLCSLRFQTLDLADIGLLSPPTSP
jgi:hypothetical protein